MMSFTWYEEQAVGLGYEFLDELDQSLRLIASFPKLQPLKKTANWRVIFLQ